MAESTLLMRELRGERPNSLKLTAEHSSDVQKGISSAPGGIMEPKASLPGAM